MGYVLIEGWSLFDSFYMTAISITTVGFGETKPLSHAGKIFTVILIFTGLGAAAVFATQLAKAFLESRLQNFFGVNKMLKKINRLKGHYIICGYGGVGSAICSTLHDSGIKFVVVEHDETVAKWAESKGFLTVVGKATYDETLLQAGIKSAKGIVMSMGDDSLNMYVSLAARELNREIFIIARGYKADIESRLVRAGANTVVYPIKMGGEQIAHLIKKQLDSSESDKTREISSTVMGYALKHYKHYGGSVTTVGDLKKNLKLLNIVSLKKHGSNNEIQNPENGVSVSENDELLFVVSGNQQISNKIDPSSLFFWKESYSVGDEMLDEEHQDLFLVCFEFVDAVKRGMDQETVQMLFSRVLEDIMEHNENEEKLFKQYNYPDEKKHIKAHSKMVDNISKIDKSRNFNMDIEKVLFVSLIDHIEDYDRKLIEYIKEEFHG